MKTKRYLIEYEEKFLFFKPKKKLMIIDDLPNLHFFIMIFNFESILSSVKIIKLYKITELK